MTRQHKTIFTWVLLPVAVAALTGFLGRTLALEAAPRVGVEPRPRGELERLEAAPTLAVANAVWAFGDRESAKNTLRAQLDHLGDSDATAPHRARLLLRFGIIDDNPDGQAAVFALVCATDPSLCADMKTAAARETSSRFVSPGNELPPYFGGGHP